MARTVQVCFATNRQPLVDATGKIVDFASDPGPVHGLAVRFGTVQVVVDQGAGAIVPGSLAVEDENLVPLPGNDVKLGSTAVFDALRRDMIANDRPTIVFVHGFSNTFADAMTRAATIVAFYGEGGYDANIFAFSWPSVGSPIAIPMPGTDYQHDRRTAAVSGPAMARTLRILYDYMARLPDDQRCRQPLHLLCHSMGNYALRFGLQAMMQLPSLVAATDPSGSAAAPPAAVPPGGPDPTVLVKTFDQIILAAADEDDDAFDDPNKLKYLPRLGNAVTVYYNKKDWILSKLSAITKDNGPRLGTGGPDNMTSISDKVSAVDVSGVEDFGEDWESHQYYRIIPAVRDDIDAVLGDVAQNRIPHREPVLPGRWRLVK